MTDEVYMRVWQLLSPKAVGSHLLIVGHLTGDCANCKQVGIDYKSARVCPKCNTEFRYIASRSGHQDGKGSHGALVKKIREKRPDLVFVDLGDYKAATEKNKARDFFG